ncbi:winged helix-turn-helix domain-containing protein [Elioraea sp.]|uniref:winged helix-turn-helix domain-containing protein n=1 Tax=Elioraea sp. TaxID=2185103 RepID=UPI0025C06F81|nr:winged helix-turn-helix domain-containing protein [Elioraea sp.]
MIGPERRIGRLRVLPVARQVFNEGEEVRVGGRGFELLLALAEAEGALVPKQTLMRRGWPGTLVGDNTLQAQVAGLRRALGADAGVSIRTDQGRGYRLVVLQDARPQAPARWQPALAVLAVEAPARLAEPAQALGEEVAAAIGQHRWVTVLDAAAAQQARYLLAASLRREGGVVRLAARLLEAASGRQVWARRFDRPDQGRGGGYGVLDGIAADLAGALEPALRQVEIERAVALPDDACGAYDLYLRAQPLCQFDTDDNTRDAVAMLRRAIIADPGFAPARGALAGAIARRIAQRWSGDDDVAEAVQLARAATGRGSDADPPALASAAYVLAFAGRDVAAAQAEADRALALAPNSPTVLHHAAWVSLYAGAWREAIARVGRAMALSPTDPFLHDFFAIMGVACFVGGDHAVAADWLGRATSLRPGYGPGHLLRASSLWHAGRPEEAAVVARTASALLPGERLGEVAARSALSGELRARYLDGLRAAGFPG